MMQASFFAGIQVLERNGVAAAEDRRDGGVSEKKDRTELQLFDAFEMDNWETRIICYFHGEFQKAMY